MNKRKPKSYSVLEVLNFSDVGLIFEFYSTKDTNFMVSDLAKITGKNIILTNEARYYPSYSNALLIKEYNAKKSRYSFSLAPQNYHAVLPLIESISNWITGNCETTHDTQLKMSLSFDHKHLETLATISQMNPIHLILKLDENYIYTRFPNQKNSPYALSIKLMATPTNMLYINEGEIVKNINNILKTPQSEYYGIDFSEYTRGILSCNYAGGKNYTANVKNITDVLEYFIIKTYQSLNEENYSEFELNEMKRLSENISKIQLAYYDPEIFLKEFTEIKPFINLKISKQILKTYWTVIRNPIFEMIVNGGLRKGIFNYDLDLSKFQVKDAKLEGLVLKNIEFKDCELSGIMENCSFTNCKISKARLYNSKIIKFNKIEESYLSGATINRENKIHKCFIINNEEIINCPITESIIKFATPGKDLTLDENSTLIIKELPLPRKSEAVQVEGIRDYSWIKKMNASEDKGFQNEYIRNKYLK